MSSAVSEIVYYTLKPGVNIFESPSAAADSWQEIIGIIQKLKGYQRLRYGVTLEIPDLLLLIIDWDSIDDSRAFKSDPSFKRYSTLISPLTTSFHIHHATLTPFPPEVFDSTPCIEFATFYHVEPEFLSNVAEFLRLAAPDAEGVLGATFGESVEDDVIIHGKRGQEDESGGKAVVLAIGWRAREDHMKYRETESFAKYIHFLRENKGEGAEMFHIIPFTSA